MKISQYIQRALPSIFGKASLLEDLRFARTQFSQMADVLNRADKALGTKYKSDEMRRVQQVFSGVSKSGGKSVFGFIAANQANIVETIETLEAITAGEFDDKIAAKGLNYRKANLVQLIDAITFTARYSAKLLTFAMKHEIAAAREEKKLEVSGTTDVVPYDAQWIETGLIPFSQAITAIAKPAKEMIDRLDQIPDILADENNYSTLKATLGETKIDPFLFSVSNFAWNPIRRIRMHAVEAKIARAKESETQLQMTKLQMLQLDRARAGKDDPAIEREIRYLQSLADSLTRELAELNED